MTSSALPEGWSRQEWQLRQQAAATAPEERTEEQWEILDRPALWPESAPDEDGEELYPSGAGEMLEQ